MSIVLGGWSASLWWGGGPFLPVFMVSLCGFPAWGHFCKFRFRDGCYIGLVSSSGAPFRLHYSAGGGSVVRSTSSPVVFVG